MTFELVYSTNFPGSSVSSWETGAWTTLGTPSGESFTSPGVTGTYSAGEGYLLPISAINLNPARDFIIELAISEATSYYTGPFVTDSSGLGAYSATWNSPVAALVLQLNNYGYSSGNFQSGPGFPSTPYRLRLNKSAAGYNVTYSTDDGTTWTSPSANIGVASDTLSQVGIVMGAGGVSDQTFSFTEFKVWQDIPPDPPEAVTGIIVSALSTQATLNWTPLDTADSYEYRINGGTAQTSPNGATPTADVFGLTSSTTYTVEVRGVNPRGPGAWSTPVSFTTTSTTYYFDDFDRANSTTSLGSPVVGGPYTVRVGTWGINSNRAYTPVSTAAAQVTVDLGVTDYYFSANIAVISPSSGLMFHWVDTNNFYLWHRTTTDIILYRRINGTFTAQHSMSLAGVANDKMAVVTRGDRFWYYLNDKLRGSWINQYASTTTVGLYMSSTTSGRFDNAQAVPYLSLPDGADGGGAEVMGSSWVETATDLGPLPGFVYKGRNTHVEDSISGVA